MKGRQIISCRQPVKLAINSSRLEENVSGRDGMSHASPPLDPLAYLCSPSTKILATPLGHRFDSRVPAAALSGSIPGQFVHTRVPLSASSIIWHYPKGSDAVRLSTVDLASRWPCVTNTSGMSPYMRAHGLYVGDKPSCTE